jgi:hypothetical protein
MHGRTTIKNAFVFYEDGNIKPPKAVEFCDAKYSHKNKC